MLILDTTHRCHLDRAQRAEKSALITRIESQWGTLEAFQKEFVAKGVGLFGSGWVWLQADAAGTLSIGQYPGADNPGPDNPGPDDASPDDPCANNACADNPHTHIIRACCISPNNISI